MSLNYFEILLFGSVLLFVTLIVNKFASRFGVSSLLVALGVGLFFGNGGKFDFSYEFPDFTLRVSEVALSFIIFSGGFHSQWSSYKSIFKEGITLSTLGVLVTTFLIAVFCYFIFDFPFFIGLLLGSVVSSTDAAAVFSILENNKLKLKHKTAETLEFESGTNDPMAYFLTISFSLLIKDSEKTFISIIPEFFISMSLGALSGAIFGFLLVALSRKLTLKRGQNPVFFVAAVILIYAVNNLIGGSSFLAVFVAGVIVGNYATRNKEFSLNFFEGIAWLMETILFLLLGLEILLSDLDTIILTGIYISLFLIFIARPAGVFFSYLFYPKSPLNKKLFISWVGLRGATPLVFALIPVVHKIEGGNNILNLTFIIVTTSLIMQGFTIKAVAHKLKLSETQLDET